MLNDEASGQPADSFYIPGAPRPRAAGTLAGDNRRTDSIRKAELAAYAAVLIGAVAIAVISTALVFRGSAGGGAGNSGAAAPEGASGPGDLQAFFIANDLERGRNRLSFRLRLGDGTPIRDDPAQLRVTYAQPVAPGAAGTPRGRAMSGLDFRPWPTGGGVYVGEAEFDEVGPWDFTVLRTSAPDGSPAASAEAVVFVKDAAGTPAVGEPPPPTPSKTASGIEEVKRIASWLPPGPDPRLYAISVDGAVASGKPTVVSFATPAYCTSFTCGPQVEVLSALRDRYSSAVHFIHVEIFDNPGEMEETGDPTVGRESPVVAPWRLPSEPWTFIIGSDGLVAAKFDAFVTEEELAETLDGMINLGGATG